MKKVKLSTKEQLILNLIIDGKRNRDIASEVLTKKGEPTNEKTISTYKARLIRKIGLDSTSNIIEIAKVAQEKGFLPKTTYTKLEVYSKLLDYADDNALLSTEKDKKVFAKWIDKHLK